MDIKIPSDLPATKPAVAQVDQLLAQLKAAGRIEAEVVKLLQNNQLLLSSRIGDILTSNSLNYKAGDKVYLRLDDSGQQPVLKTSPRPAEPTIVDSRQNPQLIKALPPDRPMLARVIKIVAQQAEIQLAEQILKLPREVKPVRNQLLSLQRIDKRHSIEITALDNKAIYKAILKQLLPRQAENMASSLIKLLNMINSSPARPAQTASPPPPASRQQPATDAKPATTASPKADATSPVARPANKLSHRLAGTAAQTSGGSKTRLHAVVLAAGSARPSALATKPFTVTGPNNPKPSEMPTAMPGKRVDPTGVQRAVIAQGAKPAANNPYNPLLKPGPTSPHRVTPNPANSAITAKTGNPPFAQKTGNQPKTAAPVSDKAPGLNSKPSDQAAIVANAGSTKSAGAMASSTQNAGPGTAPALQPLLQLITRFPEIDASALKKWLEFARLIYKPKSESASTAPADIFRVLKQFSAGEGASRELSQMLNQHQRAAADGDSPAARAAAQEALSQQIRDGIKLVEQSLSHNLLQRASLGLQQETQQPFTLSLALPFLEEEQTKPLYIDLAQRKRAQQEEDKSWDIRLSFDITGLGPVSCHLVLEGCAVAASFYSEQAQTRDRIAIELPQLRQQLTRAGFTPGEFHSFPGAPAPERAPTASGFAETLIDVEA